MALFNRAEALARHNPDDPALPEIYYGACLKEIEAANKIPPEEASEPTRSILFISAATMALRARNVSLAERLACDGLRGYPGPFHRRELHTLLEQATLELHLAAQGQELDPADLHISLSGQAAGGGIIMATDFERRLDNIGTMVKRSYMRLQQLDYVPDLRAKVDNWYADGYKLALAAPQAGSFAIRIKLIRPQFTQLKLMSHAVTPEKVITDIIDKMTLLQEGKIEALEKSIDDDKYLTNFLSSAGEIMPDGVNVNLVTLVSNTNRVALQKPRKAVKQEVRDFNVQFRADRSSEKAEERVITGTLDEARRGKKKGISITGQSDEGPIVTKVQIKDGLEDIVRSYFGMVVRATGYMEKSVFHANDIEGVEIEG